MLLGAFVFVIVSVKAKVANKESDTHYLDKKRFTLIWNTSTGNCKKYPAVKINLDKFGIEHNANQSFHGEKINLLYSQRLGYYPYIHKNGTWINGGIPQKHDLHRHLERAAKDVEKVCPKDFDGIGIIDWEEWSPTYEMNWGNRKKYRKASLELAGDDMAKAIRDFNAAAKKLMLETMKLCQKLRPKAKWGYYGFPNCGNNKEGRQCNDEFYKHNHQLSWLYEASDALYPSIYLEKRRTWKQYKNPRMNQIIHVRKDLRMTVIYAKKFGKEIYPYVQYLWGGGYEKKQLQFHMKDEICACVKQASDWGADGVLIWGSFNSNSKSHLCKQQEKYLHEIYGPMVKRISDRTEECVEKRCSGHGRCIFLEIPEHCDVELGFQNYFCKCDPGYEGEFCEYKIS